MSLSKFDINTREKSVKTSMFDTNKFFLCIDSYNNRIDFYNNRVDFFSFAVSLLLPTIQLLSFIFFRCYRNINTSVFAVVK